MKKKGNAKTNLRIIAIRDRYKLTRNALAGLCQYSRNTVDAWLLPPNSKSYRKAPERAARLLEFETRGREPWLQRFKP